MHTPQHQSPFVGIFKFMSKRLDISQPTNAPIRQISQDCTITQQIGTESVEYTECKDVYVFASGTVVVPGVVSDRVLHPAAGPIKITRTGNDPDHGFDFD